MDSDLEAFSRNPTDGSFAVLASQLATFTKYLIDVAEISELKMSAMFPRSSSFTWNVEFSINVIQNVARTRRRTNH